MNVPLPRSPTARVFLAAGLLLLLSGCGGSQGFTSSSALNANAQVEIGSVTNGTFTSGVLAITPATVAPGGTATVTAVLQYSNGTTYSVPTPVTFSSTCVLNKTATITSSVTTNASGEAVATYSPGTGCSGTDTIQAQATVNNVALIATGSVTVSTSTAAVVDDVTPGALAGPHYVPAGTVLRVPFLVRGPDGLPLPGRDVVFRVLGGQENLLLASSALSDARGLATARLRVPRDARGLRVIAVLAGDRGAGVGTASPLYRPAASVRHALLSVVPAVLDAGSVRGRVTDAVWVTATGKDGVPLPDGTRVALAASHGRIPAFCVLSAGRCRVVWSEGPRALNAGGYGRMGLRARLLAPGPGAAARGVFVVSHDRARVRLVRRVPTATGVDDLVSVTAGRELLPAGSRVLFRAVDGRVVGADTAVTPDVLAAPGDCAHGADPARGCYRIRLAGRHAQLEVVVVAPGGVLSGRTVGGASRARP